MQNFSNLPDEVLRAEFPQLYAQKLQYEKTKNTDNNKKNIFIDQENDNFYLKKGDTDTAIKYNLINANRSLKRPELKDDAHLSADQLISNWGKLDDENIFDTTNKNWDEIRDYLQSITRKINSLIDFITSIEPYLDLLAANKDIDLTTILVNLSDKYYKKSEMKNKLEYLQKQINNLNHYVGDRPQPNSNFAQGFTGNPDYNDKIYDSKINEKVDRMSDEDEKGEN